MSPYPTYHPTTTNPPTYNPTTSQSPTYGRTFFGLLPSFVVVPKLFRLSVCWFICWFLSLTHHIIIYYYYNSDHNVSTNVGLSRHTQTGQ